MTEHALRVIAFLEHPLFIHAFDALFRARGYRWRAMVCPAWYADARAYAEIMKAVPRDVDVLICRRMDSLVEQLAGVSFDILCCLGYPRRIPVQVLERARLGALNGHPSLLPRYRGPNPVGWAFRNGDARLGFTVHRMEHDFDTGAILARTEFPLSVEDDIDSVLGTLGERAPACFSEALERLERGEPGEPQAHADATYAGAFEPEYAQVDWRDSARSIHDKVRSLCGQGAIARLGSETIRIMKTSLDVQGLCLTGAPGTALQDEGGTTLVQCGDRPLRLQKLLPANPVPMGGRP